jgi:hypothetical protein
MGSLFLGMPESMLGSQFRAGVEAPGEVDVSSVEVAYRIAVFRLQEEGLPSHKGGELFRGLQNDSGCTGSYGATQRHHGTTPIIMLRNFRREDDTQLRLQGVART